MGRPRFAPENDVAHHPLRVSASVKKPAPRLKISVALNRAHASGQTAWQRSG